MINLTREQMDLMRQWFNSVQDLSPDYLEPADYALAAKIHEALEMRVPNSISKHLSNISATSPTQTSKDGN